MSTSSVKPNYVLKEFLAAERQMGAGLLERKEELRMCMTALLCKEHVLLVGPPGTAKSMLIETIAQWTGLKFFNVLVSKFTTPEEVFGPLDLTELKQGKYRRVTDDMLPEAGCAFIDEIFKASSAILNTTLKILNERRFKNGTQEYLTPLQFCLAASNEWPGTEGGGHELDAVFDRFLFRKSVSPMKNKANITRLMFDNLDPKPTKNLSTEELAAARLAVAQQPWSQEAKELMYDIKKELAREGITPGDRRLRKSVSVVQAESWLNEDHEVRPENLGVLSNIMWCDPLEQPKKAAEIINKIANPGRQRLLQLVGEAEEIMDKLPTTPNAGEMLLTAKKLDEIMVELKKLGATAKEAVSTVMDHKKALLKAGGL